MFRTFAVSAVVVLSLTSCQRDEGADYSQANSPSRSVDSTQNPTAGADRTSTMNPTVPPTGTTGGDETGATTAQQRVELNEYSIRMPQTLAAGQQSFSVVNGGKEIHSLEIEGNGVHLRLPADLPRGESATLDVNLKPGTYEVYCPVEGHKGKGMTTQITVK